MSRKLAYSPHITSDELPNGPQTLDDKIRVFEDRVLGWQLDVAEQTLMISHSGFATLSIVASYFELIGKCIEGPGRTKIVTNSKGKKETRNWGSGDYAKAGIKDVYPELQKENPTLVEELLRVLYGDLRCGLYHQGVTGAGVVVSGSGEGTMELMESARGDLGVRIHPEFLVQDLKTHFQEYVARLRNTANTEARESFKAAFDAIR